MTLFISNLVYVYHSIYLFNLYCLYFKTVLVVFQMGKKLAVLLEQKIKHIRSFYKTSTLQLNEVVIGENEEQLFESMQRWHQNSHVTDTEWFDLYCSIKHKLKVEAQYDGKMPKGLQKFLKLKFASNSLMSKFSVSDIFPDGMVQEIFKYYRELVTIQKEQSKLMKEDSVDSFDLNVFLGGGGVSQEEISFYHKVFLPLAIYEIYSAKHTESLWTNQLMNDCFTLGSGSKRKDLCPEVNAFCQLCCGDEWFSKYDHENKNIFLQQVANKFQLPYIDSEDSVSFEERSRDSIKSKQVSKDDIENPFMSDCSEDVPVYNENDTENKAPVERDHGCSLCLKSFSCETFLMMHTNLFHAQHGVTVSVGKGREPDTSQLPNKARRCLLTEFVSDTDAVDLMTSYVNDGGEKNDQVVKRKSGVLSTKFIRDPVDFITSFSIDDCESNQYSGSKSRRFKKSEM